MGFRRQIAFFLIVLNTVVLAKDGDQQPFELESFWEYPYSQIEDVRKKNHAYCL